MNASSDHKRDNLPEWALTHAQASIRCGMNVLLIEKSLVSKGLTPEEATAVVDHCFDARYRSEANAQRASMVWMWTSRVLSLIVACGVVATAYHLAPARADLVARTGVGLLLPLACIWFPGPLGRYVGYWGIRYVSQATPTVFVAIAGWIVMLAVTIVMMAVVV